MVFCRICGRESKKRVCNNCQYFLDNGSAATGLIGAVIGYIFGHIYSKKER